MHCICYTHIYVYIQSNLDTTRGPGTKNRPRYRESRYIEIQWLRYWKNFFLRNGNFEWGKSLLSKKNQKHEQKSKKKERTKN